MESGEQADTITLSEIAGHMMDEGWLSYYDGRVYLTTYSIGLFGAGQGGTGQIVKVEVGENGELIDESVIYTPTYQTKNASEFIVYNGRGYVNAFNELQVYDVDTMTLIYSERGAFTHGGMMMNTGYATEENGYLVYLYIVPYRPTDLIVFEDRQGQTEGKRTDLNKDGKGMGLPQYSNTLMRSGPNGELIWWNDTSVMFIYGRTIAEKDYNFFIADGGEGKWVKSAGATPGDALSKIDGMAVSDISGAVTYNGTTMSVGYLNSVNFAGTESEGWVEWGFGDKAHDYHRYWIISSIGTEGSWYHEADGKKYSEKDAIGKAEIFGMTFASDFVSDSAVNGNSVTVSADVDEDTGAEYISVDARMSDGSFMRAVSKLSYDEEGKASFSIEFMGSAEPESYIVSVYDMMPGYGSEASMLRTSGETAV
jgi:hypothetical protein